MAFSACPLTAFAADTAYMGGLCEHHTEHNEECGYTEAVEESPCTHEHTDNCYRLVTDCVHEHTEKCYSDGKLPAEGEEKEADNCSHVCSEESGCVTKELDCEHEHNGDCGYVEAVEGSPCGYWCGICAGETEESDKTDVTDEIEETDEIDKTEEIDETDETEETEESEESEKSFSPMSERAIEPKKPDNGNGSEDDPYQISTAAELYWFAGLVNGEESIIGENIAQDIDACAALMNDIDLNPGITFDEDGNFEGGTPGQWTPICKSSYERYEGTFDGQNHTISGLYIDSEDRLVGLFGSNSGIIKNLKIEDSYVRSKYDSGLYAGAVCGYNCGDIKNCYNYGTVSGEGTNIYVGGVCGRNAYDGSYGFYGTLKDCQNTGTVIGTGYSIRVGGVCGYNNNNSRCIIESCENMGEVIGKAVGNEKAIGNAFVGGVSGYNDQNGTIESCENMGEVTGEATGEDGKAYVGGITSYNKKGTIESCENTGKITGEATDEDGKVYVGGITSYNREGTIESCYNTGKVSADGTESSYAGGICGHNERDGVIKSCDNTGKITGKINGEANNESVKAYVGGICSFNGYGNPNYESIIENCSNTGEVSGYSNSWVGGICGYNFYSDIKSCYNTGAVSGDYISGGVCGQNSNSAIENCYNTGEVVGQFAGGVCGFSSSGTIGYCYNVGKISPSGTSSDNIGGVCGQNSASSTINNCYFLKETADKGVGNDINNSGATATPLTMEQMTGQAARTNMSSFDFTNTWGTREGISTRALVEVALSYYPYLQVFGPESAPKAETLEIMGMDEDENFLIETAEDLQKFADIVNGTLSDVEKAA